MGTRPVFYKVTQEGAEASGSATVSIARKEVVISGIRAQNKTYDGTTDATLIYTDVLYAGKIDGDDLSVTAVGAFEDAALGMGKAVAIGSITLEGAKADNYALAAGKQQTATTASITGVMEQPAPDGLTVTNASSPDAADGAINGVTEGMEYVRQGGTQWRKVTGDKITGLSAGSYQVRYAKTDAMLPGPAVTVEVKVIQVGEVTVYAVKRTPNGTWEDNAEAYETLNNSSVYKAAELFENFRLTAYSMGAYAEASARTAAHAGENVPLKDAEGRLYLYFARNSFDIVFYSDGEGTKEWKRKSALYEENLSEYESLKLDNDAYRTFAGWSLEPGVTEYKGNEDKVVNWKSQTMPGQTLKVYPVWVDNQLNIRLDLGAYDSRNDKWWYTDHSRNYDRNTPANMDEAQSRHFWVSIGEAIDMGLMNQATRNGYSLEGWHTQSGLLWNSAYCADPEFCDRDANGNIDFQEDTEYRNWYYSITLTAKWTANARTVLYDLNGGSGDIADSASYHLGDTVKVSDKTPTPPDKQLFVGWLDRNEGLHKSGTSFTFSENSLVESRSDGAEYIVLTAQYEPEPEPGNVTITFDTDGGSLVASISQKPGTSVAKPTNPLKRGYDFAGWSQDIPSVMPDADMTIQALWNPHPFQITFDTGAGTPVDTVIQDYGTTVTPPANPTLTGYEFKGWNPALPAVMPGENMTVSAQWTVKTYSVHFNANGGSDVADITGIYGSRITPPADPTREGYTFGGWDTEIPEYMPDAELTIQALWKANQTAPDAPKADDALSTPSSVTVKAEAGKEYSIDGGATWVKPENGQATFENLRPNTEYAVIARMAATDDKEASEPSAETKVTTSKKEQEPPERPSVRSDTNTSVTVDPAHAGAEYSVDGGATWVKPDENGQVIFKNLTPGVQTVIARMEETESQKPSEPSDPVTIDTENSFDPTKVVLTNSDLSVTDTTITVKTPAQGTGYEYRLDNGEWQDSAIFDNLKPNTNYVITVRQKATDATQAGTVSDPLTVKTPKTANTDKPALTADDIEATDSGITVKNPAAGTGYQYSIDGGETWRDSATFSNLEPNTEYSVTVRQKETDTTQAGQPATVTVTTPKQSNDDKPTLTADDIRKTDNGITVTKPRRIRATSTVWTTANGRTATFSPT